MNMEIITLEDNNDYGVLAIENYQEIKYYFLVNINDNEHFVIRKKVDNELRGLDSEEELTSILKLFVTNKRIEFENE